jgi:phenylpropionate dioxygenase-like ring-hydroxylating dioxygenase large terminal subunit
MSVHPTRTSYGRLGPDVADRSGLPRWTYFNEEVLELEKDRLFRRCWQLVCHASDLPSPGDFMTFDVVGERAIVIRGKDGQIRGFHNLCRHRGSRIVREAQGHCDGAIVCPFHGWAYEFDGRLRGVSRRHTLPALDPAEHGLIPIETEVWMGFIFVRFLPSDQPSIADMLAPLADQIAPYRLEDLRPLGGVWTEQMAANWKAVRDVDNEGYHVAVAHPSLQDLYGDNYKDDYAPLQGMVPAFSRFKEGNARQWSVRAYRNILPEASHLPESHRRAWFDIGIFPNQVISLYPDQVGFYQEFPLAVNRTGQRSAGYALPDNRREMKLARYLSSRIDRVTSKEDIELIQWSWEAMQSSGFKGVILSDLEAGVRHYHDKLRRLIPVMTLDEAPPQGDVRSVNDRMVAADSVDPWAVEPLI